MKIKVWTKTTDNGDGSSSITHYPTKTLAYEGVDEDGFEIDKDGNVIWEVPVEIDWHIIDVTECEVIEP